ncbi:MAG: hypothetical protein ACLBM4_16900 [Dolichospermum sp.]
MSERKVNLEQSLIVQEQELLNPPSDGPIPEFALYRALRMAELAILGELERLTGSHKIVGLQLEYQSVEITETEDKERIKLLHEQAPIYFVNLGKLIDEEEPQKIEKYQNLPEEEQESLNIELIINLVEKLKEYLILHTPPYKLLNNKIHLNLQIQLNPQITTYKSCDRDCIKECGHSSASRTRKGIKKCACSEPC